MKVTFKPNMLNLLNQLKAEFYETNGYEPNTVVVSEQEYKELISEIKHSEIKHSNGRMSYVVYPDQYRAKINGLFVELE